MLGVINKFNEEKNNVTLIPGGVSWEFPAIASLNCLDHGTVTEIATNDANTLLDFFFFFLIWAAGDVMECRCQEIDKDGVLRTLDG